MTPPTARSFRIWPMPGRVAIAATSIPASPAAPRTPDRPARSRGVDTARQQVRGRCMRAHGVPAIAMAALLVGLAPQQSLGAGPDPGAQAGRPAPLSAD